MSSYTKYIFSNSALTRDSNSLKLRTDSDITHIPIAQIKELFCFNDTTLSTKVLQLLSTYGVTVHFFNYYGSYIGSFYPKESLVSGKLTILQAQKYSTDRYNIAGAIVEAIAQNIRTVLYHYYRHGCFEVKSYIDELNTIHSRLNIAIQSKNIHHLLSLEGYIWANFYSQFKYFLPKDFILDKRVKQPPDNPINALISFGNSLLYTKTLSQIYNTHLNPSISFLHEPSESRFSLSLDLCEAFKPIIVFRTIFDCINNRKLSISKHFISELNYCLLNDEGKKIYIAEFEKRLNTTFEHTKLNRKVSYQTCIRLDAYNLTKCILEDIPFIPFKLEKKQ